MIGTGLGPALVRAVTGLLRAAVTSWRRSLQLRVVTTTLLVSGVVVVLLGIVLLDQVTQGLLEAKVRVAFAEGNAGVRIAQSQLVASDATDDASLGRLLDELTVSLANRGGAAGLYEVVVLGNSNADNPLSTAGRIFGDEIRADSVPSRLSDYVVKNNRIARTYAELRYADGHSTPGLVVGAPVNAGNLGTYQLYYLFPLTQEISTIRIVERTLVFTGLAIVLLLAGVAYLVTRQVVTPVREAASTAERLAAGLLEERMATRGEDDLARLAMSFNRMAEALQRQIRQLEELSRVQRRFVSDVSHELRTPLTTVRMAADVLHEARGDFEPAVARSAELLQTELNRFEALLVDLLEISRHDAGAVVLEPEPTDLRAVADRVVEAAEPLAARRGSAITRRMPASPVVAECDPRRIERVLRNLVVNAIEHGDGRPIEVTVGGAEDAAAVTVRDHGVGLRSDEVAMVFTRFWRADPARARATGGTGLGLAIALEDTHLHGGWLEAWGAPGQGAQFRLTLPCTVGAELTSSPLPLQPVDGLPAVVPGVAAAGQPAQPCPALPALENEKAVDGHGSAASVEPTAGPVAGPS